MKSVLLLTVFCLAACGGSADLNDLQGSSGSSNGPQHTLTIDKPVYGAIVSGPTRISCGDNCKADFDEDSEVRLTATPAPGYLFEGWTGVGCNTSQPVCAVFMHQDVRVGASFKLADPNGY